MLHNLSPAAGSRKRAKRVGRGNSANGGTTAGRGTKGQHSRSGAKMRHGFEGGQTPLLLRQPKLGGFKNPRRIEYEVLNLEDLETQKAGKYDVQALQDARLVRTRKPVKLLARGKVTKKFEVTVNAASKSAIEAIEAAGGKVQIIS